MAEETEEYDEEKEKEIEKKIEAAPEEPVMRLRTPRKKDFEMFAIVTKMQGTNKLLAICEDGLERQCRIAGKLKKRVWIRENDLIIVKIWDFQPIKADVVWRFLEPAKNYFRRKGMLTKLPV